jgi:hypothetical protein
MENYELRKEEGRRRTAETPRDETPKAETEETARAARQGGESGGA